jgi:Spy/CpxP family protein refolding chaperone
VNSWKVILATMVIFGTGVVTGGLLVRFTGVPVPQRQQAAQAKPAPPFSAGGMRLDFLRRVGKDLDLTADQRERVNQIFRESQERTKKIMEPVSPLLREEVKRTRAEFVDVLTPEQRAHFAALAKQQQQQQQQRARESRALREPQVEGTSAPPPAATPQ